jgi:hypothetical protein
MTDRSRRTFFIMALCLLSSQAPGFAGGIGGFVGDTSANPASLEEVELFDASGNFVDSATTDPGGTYLFTNLTAGTYYVRTFVFTNLLDEWFDDVAASSFDPLADGATPVTIGAGTTNLNVNFSLSQGAQIAGQVLDENSNPISNASVIATYADGTIVANTTSSASGDYTLDVLPAGTLYVRSSNTMGFLDEWFDDVLLASANPVTDGATGVPVTEGMTTPGVDFRLTEGGTIGGRVSGPGNLSLEGIDIDVFDTNGNFVRGGTTAADGTYTVIALPTGTYFVNTFDSTQVYLDKWYNDILLTSLDPAVDQPSPVGVLLGNHTPNVDFQLEPPGSITGVLLDTESTLVEWVPVELRRPDGSLLESVVSDATGSYTFSRVPAGSYHLRSGAYDKRALRDVWLGGALVVANDPGIEGSVPVDVPAGGALIDADMILPIPRDLRLTGIGFLDLTVRAGDTYRIMRATDALVPLPWPDAPSGTGPGESSLFTSSSNGVVSYADPTMADYDTGVYGYERLFTFLDDMEGGPNGWTIDHGTGLNVDWAQTNRQACSGLISWFATNTVGVSDLYLVSPAFLLDADPDLAFWHWYNTEQNFDGGQVEISTNGTGGPWSDLGESMTLNGYNHPSMGNSSVFAGQAAFSGDSGGFIRTEIDLLNFSGQTVHIRFRMASDSVENRSGWFVDDVQVR